MASSHSDMIRIFQNHPEAFAASVNLADFAKRSGLGYLERYAGGWADDSFRQHKFRPDIFTYHALWLPEALRWQDVFSAIWFQASPMGARGPEAIPDPRGGYYCGTTRGMGRAGCQYFGGKRTLRHFEDGTVVRGIFGGAVFHTLRAVPCADVLKAWRRVMGPTETDAQTSDRFGHLSGFEIVKRDDGYLVLAKDGSGICSRYVALIPLSEDLAAMLPAEDVARIESAEALDKALDAILTTNEAGQTVATNVRAEYVTVCGESYWQADFKRRSEPEGPFYALLNGNGGSARFSSRKDALNAAQVAAGYEVHR